MGERGREVGPLFLLRMKYLLQNLGFQAERRREWKPSVLPCLFPTLARLGNAHLTRPPSLGPMSLIIPQLPLRIYGVLGIKACYSFFLGNAARFPQNVLGETDGRRDRPLAFVLRSLGFALPKPLVPCFPKLRSIYSPGFSLSLSRRQTRFCPDSSLSPFLSPHPIWFFDD